MGPFPSGTTLLLATALMGFAPSAWASFCANSYRSLGTPLGHHWELRSPLDGTPRGEFVTYGRPRIENGQWMIDFLPGATQWSQGRHLHYTAGTPGGIRKIPYADFEDLALPGMKQRWKSAPPDEVVFLPASSLPKKGAPGASSPSEPMQAYRIESTSEEGGSLELRPLVGLGPKRQVSARELLFWNLDIADSEKARLRELARAGIPARLVPGETGSAITLAELPPLPTTGESTALYSFQLDREVHEALAAHQKAGVPIVLREPGLPTQPARGLEITPESDIYAVKAAHQRWQDSAPGGLATEISEKLARVRRRVPGILSEKDAQEFQAFLLEQRARATEIEAMAADLFKRREQKIIDASQRGARDVPYLEYFRERAKRAENLVQERYSERIEWLLDRARLQSEWAYAELYGLLRNRAIRSDTVGLHKLFPGHF